MAQLGPGIWPCCCTGKTLPFYLCILDYTYTTCWHEKCCLKEGPEQGKSESTREESGLGDGHPLLLATSLSFVAVLGTFPVQPIGGNEMFFSPAFLFFRSDENDRSFRSKLCLEWNQHSNSVTDTPVPIDLDRIFIWGFYDESLHIPSHLPSASHSTGNSCLQLGGKKSQENQQHIANSQSNQLPLFLLLDSTDPHAFWVYDLFTIHTLDIFG